MAIPDYEAAVRFAQDLAEAHYRPAIAYKYGGKLICRHARCRSFACRKSNSLQGAKESILSSSSP